jgi:nucleoside-diphosphate-sugar epimerase
MKQAIVLGATGYVGSKVVEKLIEDGISVLAIGRKNIEDLIEKLPINSAKLNYLQLDINNINELIKTNKWIDWCNNNETVFFNFAWLGEERLTDGTLKDQLKNVGLGSKAVEVSSKLGCIKYINAGSQEEYLLNEYLKDSWKKESYNSNSLNYAFAKLVNRDMSTLIGYLQKIDYINTRFSVAIDTNLSGNGYVSKTLQKIKNSEDFEKPNNMQSFEILDLNELAKAYILIGKYGKNKSDYYIGNGNVYKLVEYFDIFLDCKNKIKDNQIDSNLNKDKFYDPSSFFNDIKLEFKNPTNIFTEVLTK